MTVIGITALGLTGTVWMPGPRPVGVRVRPGVATGPEDIWTSRATYRPRRDVVPTGNQSLGIFNGGGAGRGWPLLSLRAAPRVRDRRCPCAP
jgi:hypothetical protein